MVIMIEAPLLASTELVEAVPTELVEVHFRHIAGETRRPHSARANSGSAAIKGDFRIR